MKIESLSPPLCLLGDDPTSPSETVQISVGPTCDDPSGNHSSPPPPAPRPQALPGRMVCVVGAQDKEEKVGEMTDNQEEGQEWQGEFQEAGVRAALMRWM